MKWLRVLLLLLGAVSLHAATTTTPPADSPETVTQNLYQVAMKHPGFSPETVKAYRPFLTRGLYAKLWKEATKKAPVGDVGDIDFDVVLGGQDSPDKFEIGDTSIDHATAKVDVTTIFVPSEKHRYTVYLIQVNGAWKVDDIDYGTEGRLSKMVK